MKTKKGRINIYKLKDSVCPFCGRFISLEDFYSEYYARMPIAGAFRNALSFEEYKVTGLCQDCQDIMFGVED